MKIQLLGLRKLSKQIQKILFLLCWVGILSVQAQSYEWALGVGGSKIDQSNDIALDASGNIYVTGSFRSANVDFDPSAGGTANLTASSIDMFFAKYTKSGDYIWAHNIGGGANTVEGLSLAVDASGNVYVTGAFSGIVDFDPSAGGVANLDASAGTGFFAKYDTNGNYVWAHNIGTRSQGIAVDASGNAYVTGYFFGTMDFDPSTGNTANLTANFLDIFFAKYDTDGNYVWAHNIGGSGLGTETGQSITVDGSGHVYITGYFLDTVDFDPSAGGTANLTSNGDVDAFFAKYDSNGNYIWAHSFGGTGFDGGTVITVDESGNVYIIGSFSSSNVDFDPSAGGTTNLSSNGSSDIFFAKYDNNGNYAWAHSIGQTDQDAGRGITVDGSGNVYITGYFRDFNVDFDPSATGTALLSASSSGRSEIYVAKYNSNGAYAWAHKTGGTSYENGTGIAVDEHGNVFFTGFFSDVDVDFDPSTGGTAMLSNQGEYDIFIAKYCQSAPSGAGSITSSATTVCQSQTGVTYTVPAIANASSYTWVLPAGANIVAGANTHSITVNFDASAVSGNVTVSGTNACGNGVASATVAITVNPLPASAGSITSSATTVCQNQTGVYSVPAIANATGYAWTLPAGANIVAGANTHSITVDFSAASSGNFTVKGTNACGDGVISAALAVAVSTPVAPAVSITSDASNNEIIQDTQVTFTATPSNTGATPTYQWQTDGKNIAGATNNTYITSTLKNGETISVLVTASKPCVTTPTASASLSLKVVNRPDQPFNITGAFTLDKMVLSWQTRERGNEAGFHILRSIGDSSSFVNIKTLGAGIRTYTDIGQSPSTQLYYKVVAFNEAGETASAIFNLLPTGIDKELANVYPNPFYNTFKVTSTALYQGKISVRLLGLQGQLIKHFGLLDAHTLPQQVFDASALSSGIYILEITTGRHVITVRVFKK